MTKAQKDLLLVLGAVAVVGLILAHSHNAQVRKVGQKLETEAEDIFIDDFL